MGTCSGGDCLPDDFQSGRLVLPSSQQQFSVLVSHNDVWVTANKKAKLGKVELNKIYQAPQNDKVEITFTSLPAEAGSLMIEEIELSDAQMEILGSADRTVYDITSDMANGSFKYDLRLPLPSGLPSELASQAKIAYAENIDELLADKATASLQLVAAHQIEKTATELAISQLDHFTVFIVTSFEATQTTVPSDGYNSIWFTSGTEEVTRVVSGTNGISSANGNAHGVINGDAYTSWNGNKKNFPVGGYDTRVSVYLDMAQADGSATKGFDFSSAINKPDGAHRRDFIFHLGVKNEEYGKWYVAASNNSNATADLHINAANQPQTINESGWYTLVHQFRDVAGKLVVTMNIYKYGESTPLYSWIRQDDADEIGVTVGGNRYGWFVGYAFDFDWLAIDAAEIEYAASPYVFNSTNELNKNKQTPKRVGQNAPYVELVNSLPGQVELRFVQPQNHVVCFEVRTDGDLSQAIDAPNPNTALPDRYPHFCLTNTTTTKTYAANEYVEVRSAFGAERDWDFDWAKFNALPGLNTPIQVGFNVKTSPSANPNQRPTALTCTDAITTINGASVVWDDANDLAALPLIKYHRQYKVGTNAWTGSEIYSAKHTDFRNFSTPAGIDMTVASRVRAFYDANSNNKFDTGEKVTDWSNVCDITLDRSVPAAPTLILPASGTYLRANQLPAQQKWTAVDKAVKYEYQSCYTDPSLNGGECPSGDVAYITSTTAPNRLIGSTAEEGNFWWQVRAVGKNGLRSNWSDAWLVIVDRINPVVQVNPGPSEISDTANIAIEIVDANPKNAANNQIWVELYGRYDQSKKRGAKVNLTSGNGNFNIDTTTLPDGDYILRIGVLQDAAGNKTNGGKDSYFRYYTVKNTVELEPTPTPSPEPSPEPTPEPTPTPSPTPEPSPVATPLPTPSPSTSNSEEKQSAQSVLGASDEKKDAEPWVCSESAPIGQPLITSLQPGVNSMTVTWTQVAGANNYAIFFTRNSDGVQYSADNVGNVSSYTINNLAADSSYSFQVMPKNGCQPGERSALQTQAITAGATVIAGAPQTVDGDDLQVLGENDELSDEEVAEALGEVMGVSTDVCTEQSSVYLPIVAIVGLLLLLVLAELFIGGTGIQKLLTGAIVGGLVITGFYLLQDCNCETAGGWLIESANFVCRYFVVGTIAEVALVRAIGQYLANLR